jgi:hypothetical protein
MWHKKTSCLLLSNISIVGLQSVPLCKSSHQVKACAMWNVSKHPDNIDIYRNKVKTWKFISKLMPNLQSQNGYHCFI